MATGMTNTALADKLRYVAQNYKTLYVRGCFGAPMTEANKARYLAHHSYNRKEARRAKISAADADTFGFDCVCLIKGILWGWEGDRSAIYGGAEYKSGGVPDIGADVMIGVCADVSEDFSCIAVGEAVWMPGHIGIYIGGGLAVECTPSWADGVQITAVGNIGAIEGYNQRSWAKHGKLPYVDYVAAKIEAESENKADFSLDLRTLKKGCRGEDVRALQILLIGRGFSCGDAGVDGSFGGATDRALRAYQAANGLEADGKAGPATMGSLLGT